MSNFTTIEIDFDVHKAIELERRSFDETPNIALRRLIGLDEEGSSNAAPQQLTDASGGMAHTQTPTCGRAWSGKGVTLPHGTKFRMGYGGRTHQGTIEDGLWKIEGKTFNSPSGAACGVALTRDGRHTNLNGWQLWHVLRPDDKGWISIYLLRSKSPAELKAFW